MLSDATMKRTAAATTLKRLESRLVANDEPQEPEVLTFVVRAPSPAKQYGIAGGHMENATIAWLCL